mmetsp:Transcript_91600/g.296358  ORF Transcript_91600/g.296358 Transcript_91600/m.296358 type:complete len:240 (+) Transcript_91600:655-1374(+)
MEEAALGPEAAVLPLLGEVADDALAVQPAPAVALEAAQGRAGLLHAVELYEGEAAAREVPHVLDCGKLLERADEGRLLRRRGDALEDEGHAGLVPLAAAAAAAAARRAAVVVVLHRQVEAVHLEEPLRVLLERLGRLLVRKLHERVAAELLRVAVVREVHAVGHGAAGLHRHLPGHGLHALLRDPGVRDAVHEHRGAGLPGGPVALLALLPLLALAPQLRAALGAAALVAVPPAPRAAP